MLNRGTEAEPGLLDQLWREQDVDGEIAALDEHADLLMKTCLILDDVLR